MEFCARCRLVYASDDLFPCEVCSEKVCFYCLCQVTKWIADTRHDMKAVVYICHVHVASLLEQAPGEEVTQ